ncbi:serine protease [Rhodococcus hoagii]|uniref:Serine protease n=3 Tax=Rhodococcus hoagii TaxID=43767 RepID=A0A9Q2SY75_RHOHA|nr:peptidase S1 family protein [Prescottella equi]ERN43901.1 peptidase [Prescottella equi NBRC 101255 = C 7]CBH50268.1 putative secreted peptidase [Prescottella equi 103S]MBM4472032.1 serine protease [Prescottella equi]MBM4474360.1 serine protease [Prescottella equi]
MAVIDRWHIRSAKREGNMLKRLSLIFAALAVIAGMLGVGTATAAPPRAVLGGGSGIVIDEMYQCTLTTIGHDNAGRLVGITAGHCGEAGWPVVPESDPDAGVVGRFVVSNSDYDYAVIEFDPAKVTPVNTIGQVTITDIGKPAQFPAVACKQGRTTGHTCGVVYGDVLQSQETWTQLCVIEGDSGSPVVVGTTLVAMVNAYLGVACLGPELGTNMTAIIDNINATGGVGAGFRPI